MSVPIPEEAIEATTKAWKAAWGAWVSLPVASSTGDTLLQSTSSLMAKAAEDAVRAAAPLIVAASSVTEVPDGVVHAAWHEYVYPRTAVERPMTPGFERAMRVINEWLAGRASVLRGEGQTK